MEIPGFQIIRQIGKGGMATVYLANQESLDREVAIKVMSPFLAEEETFGERFLREAKIVGKLSHPNIVAVYDVGSVDDQYYIAMQYSPGGDLKGKIAMGLTEQQAVLITQQIASALQYAHENGFIHRDVKPANILFDSHGNACLTDFGVAKTTRAAATTLTVAGSVIGTPTYMSPEQARGEKIDNRSDLYSLGIVFYEMLSGQPPFHGDSGVSIAIKHISDPIPKLPADFERYQGFIDKLLNKDPSERFQNGNEIIQELNNIYQHSAQAVTQIMPKAESGAQQTTEISQPNIFLSQPMFQAVSQPASQPGTPQSQPGTPPPQPMEPAKKSRWAVPVFLLLFAGAGVAAFIALKPYMKLAPTEIDSTATADKEPQPASKQAENQQQKDIKNFLELADNAFSDKNYLYPTGKSAYHYYQNVLNIDSANQDAKSGIRRIGDHYISQTRSTMRQNNLFLAEQHLAQAQTVTPDHPEIALIKAELAELKQQAEKSKLAARQQQLAAAKQSAKPPTPKPVAKPREPERKKPEPKVQSKKPVATKPAAKKEQTVAKRAAKPATTKTVKPKAEQTATPQDKPPATTTAAVSKTETVAALHPQKDSPKSVEQQIKELGKKGFALLSRKELSLDHINQAHQYYKDIEQLSPNHAKAKEGYILVVGACVNLALDEINERKYASARKIIDKGLSIDQKNRQLHLLEKRLKDTPKKEKRRKVTQKPAPKPKVEEKPKPSAAERPAPKPKVEEKPKPSAAERPAPKREPERRTFGGF